MRIILEMVAEIVRWLLRWPELLKAIEVLLDLEERVLDLSARVYQFDREYRWN